ncbi:MAG: hypothetical protein K0S41_661 [Anaerocolumna sp.]|jgi:hypothetical protein|nr:hypothetical protein [Anaerocolumna sp.]
MLLHCQKVQVIGYSKCITTFLFRLTIHTPMGIIFLEYTNTPMGMERIQIEKSKKYFSR